MIFLAINVLADVLKHFFVVLTCSDQINDIVTIEALVKPHQHIVHHLIGGRIHLINIGVVKVIFVLGGKAIHHRDGIGLAESVDTGQLLGLAWRNDYVHALQLRQGKNAVSDVKVVLSVINLEVDVLIGQTLNTV